ncbi:MAG: N-acetylmuramidase domain-containing protein [Microbacterium sp.]
MTDQELADRAGIPLRILLAIRAVESGGSASAVRFEPHVFLRLTGDRFRAQIPYTPTRGSVSLVPSETNRAAFERAFRLDPEAAVRATSWGLYQVLGGHLLRVAGPDPRMAVLAFDASPTTVSKLLLVSWFEGNPRAQAAAQAGNIPALAELYNGSQRWAEAVRRALARIPEGATAAVGGLGLALALGLGAYVFVRWQRRS